MKQRKVTWLNVLGYASINFLGSGAQALMSAWLMIFYSTYCNMSAVAAGSIFGIARLIDAVGNPIIGYISDNFGKTALGKRFGRRRFFTLIGIPAILIMFPILWTTGHSFNFYFIANLIYEIVFTMVIVTGTTLPAEMTQNALDKTKLVSAKQYCGTIASTIALAIPGFLFMYFGEKSTQAYLYTGIIYGVITSASLAVMYALTFERDPKDIVYKEDDNHGIVHIFVKMVADIGSSVQIKSFRLHSLMMLLIGIYKNLAAGIFTYFVVYVLGLEKAKTAFITSSATLVSFLALTAAIVVAYKWGGPKTFRIASVIIIASTIGYFGLSQITGSSNLVFLLIVVTIINNAGKAWADYVPVFQLPYMADIDEAVTLERREGIFTGVNSLLSKVASSIEAFAIGIGLTAFGFVTGDKTQTPSAIQGIMIMTVVAPIVLLILTWFVSLRLKLTKEKHKLLVDEVNRVKAGGAKADVTPEAKDAIEELTGYKYDQCFGNNNVGYHSKNSAATA
jgi:Na+/melibiose symporter and related transporters